MIKDKHLKELTQAVGKTNKASTSIDEIVICDEVAHLYYDTGLCVLMSAVDCEHYLANLNTKKEEA